MKQSKQEIKALLVSAPWQQDKMPCVAICALAAYSRQHGHSVETFHACRRFHSLMAGYSEDRLSASEGEAIGASLLYPKDRERILRNIKRRYGGVAELRNEADKAIHTIFSYVPWQQYDVVGFSVTHGKLYFSLLLARMIKNARGNKTHVVFGGLRSYGYPGSLLLDRFDQIDSIISGEGELAFVKMMEAFNGGGASALKKLPGIKIRGRVGILSNPGTQLDDIDDLPVPDYDEYAKALKAGGDKEIRHISLPVECSRGCYNKCTFCTDILGWDGYRTKSPAKIYKELLVLARRYKARDFVLVDRVTPHLSWWRELRGLVRKSVALRDATFFAEVRPNISREHLAMMKQAGVTRIQIGCETLSNSVLDAMRKNSTVIENIHAMKIGDELGMRVHSNLMIRFPTETVADVREICANMDHAMGCSPMVGPFDFVLEYGSYVYDHPSEFGVSKVRPSDKYCLYRAIPSYLLKKNGTLTYGFKKRKRVSYDALLDKHRRWKERYAYQHKRGNRLLTYYDLGSSGVVEDRRMGHRKIMLDSVANCIVRYCQDIRELQEIERQLKDESKKTLDKALALLKAKGILFEECGRYLSVPLNAACLESEMTDRRSR